MCGLNAMLRPASVLRTVGPAWADRGPFALAAELFRRILAHPEGVEVARCAEETNFEDHVGFEDKRVRLAPEDMLQEMRRATAPPPVPDADYPFILGAGLRTRWTANTIQRDPAWRKGRGPHCTLNLSPADAGRLGLRDGVAARVSTRRGALTLPVQIDAKVPDGYVWIPNGFGNVYPRTGDGSLEVVGVNTNELTDVADRDPFTGVPHHRYVRCRVEAVA
jgi:anaerobic selenocysteine-containing dehydrogenase